MGLRWSNKYHSEIKEFEGTKYLYVYVPVSETIKSPAAHEKAEGVCMANESSDLSDPDDTINRACVGNNISKTMFFKVLIDNDPKGANIVLFKLQ